MTGATTSSMCMNSVPTTGMPRTEQPTFSTLRGPPSSVRCQSGEQGEIDSSTKGVCNKNISISENQRQVKYADRYSHDASIFDRLLNFRDETRRDWQALLCLRLRGRRGRTRLRRHARRKKDGDEDGGKETHRDRLLGPLALRESSRV